MTLLLRFRTDLSFKPQSFFKFSETKLVKWQCIFFVFLCSIPLFSYEKHFRISGTLEDAGTANGRSYFSLKNLETGKLQHILCSPEIVREIRSAMNPSSSRKPFVHCKVKTVQIGSPLLECVGRPLVRPGGEGGRLLSQGQGGRYVSGQILDADPDSGLLTIQTSSRKSYLKVDPHLAAKVQEKLSSMQIQKIEGVFVYDRNLGYFVGQENSIQNP